MPLQNLCGVVQILVVVNLLTLASQTKGKCLFSVQEWHGRVLHPGPLHATGPGFHQGPRYDSRNWAVFKVKR